MRHIVCRQINSDLLCVGTIAFRLSDTYESLSSRTSASIAVSETLFGDSKVTVFALAILLDDSLSRSIGAYLTSFFFVSLFTLNSRSLHDTSSSSLIGTSIEVSRSSYNNNC